MFLSLFIKGIYFSGDIFNYFPPFSSVDWQRPHNSLLADPVFQFQPWRVFASEQLHAGILPLWNSMNGLGVPFLANPQTALFFPLTVFSYFLPLASGLFFIHAAKVFIYFFFTYKYLEAIHLGKRASFLGAMAAASSAFFMTWLLWPHTNVFLFLPILLFITEKIATTKRKVYLYILFSLCTAIAFFGGHPETLLQIGMVVIAYVCFRLHYSRKVILGTLLFGLIGILLTSIQLVPFLEYLFHSAAWMSRAGFSSGHSLPLLSVSQNVFPFLLGAPHLEFYRAFPGTNFQESAGGYVGIVFLLLGVYVLIAQRKKKLVLFWGIVGLFAFALAYSIPPISFINSLPVLDKSANQRFLGIFGFSVIILGSWMIDAILKKKTKYTSKGLYTLGAIGISVLLPILFLPQIIKLFDLYPPAGFEIQLQKHLLLQAASTLCFLAALFYCKSTKISQFALLTLFLFLQTGYLFWNYAPFVSRETYYPRVAMIQEMQSRQKGAYLEVGNPSLKEDSNLIYGLSSIENYDALTIDTYRKAFDRAFPVKNHWENVGEVSEKSLSLFGVRYLLSDYDLRLVPHSIEKNRDHLLPLTTNDEYRILFQPKQTTLSGVRFLTANFNRENTCSFTVSVVDAQRELYKTNQPCTKVRDKMYYFISFPEISVDSGRTYEILFKSDGSKDNSISLWGGKVPYLQIFYPHTGPELLTFHAYKNNMFLFEYPKAEQIVFKGRYRILEKSHQKVVLETIYSRKSEMQVKIPYYPGWKVAIDGRVTSINSRNAFLSFSVPTGRHRIKIYYAPESFLLGLAISGFISLLLIALFLRSLIREKFLRRFLKTRPTFAEKSSEIFWWKHAVVIVSGILFSIVSYLLIMNFLQLQFIVPESTAINWYTVNNYPRQQDYFYFYTCVLYTIVITGTVWLIWLWRKSK